MTMNNKQAIVTSAFLMTGDTIIHPKLGVVAVIHHIDNYPASGMRHFFFNDNIPACKLKDSTRVTMLGLSSMN